ATSVAGPMYVCLLTVAPLNADAAEGALGRPISGTYVAPNVGVVPPEPIWITNLGEIWFDGSIGNNHQVPIAGQTSVGLDAKVAITLATAVKVWDTGPGAWNFASGATVSYVWTEVTATLAIQSAGQTASSLFVIYFTPVIPPHHLSNPHNPPPLFPILAPPPSS